MVWRGRVLRGRVHGDRYIGNGVPNGLRKTDRKKYI
jgi:hypothetical protein